MNLPKSSKGLYGLLSVPSTNKSAKTNNNFPDTIMVQC